MVSKLLVCFSVKLESLAKLCRNRENAFAIMTLESSHGGSLYHKEQLPTSGHS